MQASPLLDGAKGKRISPRTRRLLASCLIILTPFGLFGAYHAVAWFRETTQLNRVLAETEARDPGWRLQELEARRATVADNENGALRVLAASELLPRPLPRDRAWDYVESVPLLVQLNEAQLGRLRAEMQKDALSLAQARKLADLPRGRYPVTWKRTVHDQPPPHLELPRDVTLLLHGDILLRTADGDLDGALASFRAAWNTARSFGDEPCLPSQRARLGCASLALSNLERVLGQGEPSVDAMRATSACILEEDREPLLLIAWRGERAALYDLMEAHHAGEVNNVTSLELSRRDVEARTMEFLTRMIEVAKMPSEEQVAPIKEALSELTPESDGPVNLANVHAKTCLSVLTGFRAKLLRHTARLRTASVALAAESYRNSHDGRWPQKLVDLTPAFLRELPLDPYNAEPLRYRLHDDSIVIYSVGPDLVDDNGRIDDPDIWLRTDIGIRLWNVDKRRQPPSAVMELPPNRD
jgi:hypothetical protein